jgi:hypothetical protein
MSLPHSRLAKYCLTHAATVLSSPSRDGCTPEIRRERVVVERGEPVELASTTSSMVKTTCRLARVGKDEDPGSTPVSGVVLGVRAEHKCDWPSRSLDNHRQDQCAGTVHVLVQRVIRRGRSGSCRTRIRLDECAPQPDPASPTILQLQEHLCAPKQLAIPPRMNLRRADGWRS